MSSAITKLSNQIHKQILFEEQYAAILEALKGEFGLLTSATTTPGLRKAALSVLYVRNADVIPQAFGADSNALEWRALCG